MTRLKTYLNRDELRVALENGATVKQVIAAINRNNARGAERREALTAETVEWTIEWKPTLEE